MNETVCTRLRVEHAPAGATPLIEAARPRLSWWLPDGAVGQQAFQWSAGDWESPWIVSPESVLVPWTGPVPSAGERIAWRVRVRTDLGVSDWSAPASWERATPPDAWEAVWIEPHEPEIAEAGERPAQVLRRAFTLDGPIVKARLRFTAHGIVEFFCNGVRVGDDELTPGFTAYRKRLQVCEYDVTSLLGEGRNVLEAVLSDGWFRGRHGFTRTPDGFGTRTALLAELRVSDAVIGTGLGWESRPAWFTADLMDGQREDLRAAHARRSGGGWSPVTLAEGHGYADRARLVIPNAPPVRRIREIVPTSVTALPGGAHVVDLGENVNGWTRLINLGPDGTTITLTHGESLAADGSVTTDHLRAPDFATGGWKPAGQVDQVISAGVPGDVFEPRHTTHGFRYVQVDGHPGPLDVDDVRGIVVHTDLAEIGAFACSDDRLNRLHEIAVRSFLGNACDIPTDCPQRERSGFSGDWQIFQPSAAFTHDVAAFSTKWLRDLAADQWDDGTITNVSPDPGGGGPMRATNGSAGWGDAITLVPWQLFQAYGDRGVLAEFYPAMRAWVDRCALAAASRRHPSREADSAEPKPHEEFLFDTGFHFGEWLEPGVEPHLDFGADQGIVATAYLHLSARRLAEMEGLIDKDETYRVLADKTREAWQIEYLLPDGSLTIPTQANYVRALAFDLIPPAQREAVAGHLAALIESAGNHLGTGFLTTGLLLPTLADNGHPDLAWKLLLSTGVPSWLEMVDRGATTVWERWDGAGMSLNHYSKGAVISFLHTHVAGLRPLEPGYRRFLVQPVPGPSLSWASARHESPYGLIRVAWNHAEVTVTVPPGTSAEVRLPGGVTALGPGTHHVPVR
ncbi:alpha-L-rhamnosidase [Actinoplanes lutulentus]|uniref:alpha-L-rhamnosidase n=1 Tax=Actinoplanes lutulentus TaxID=1287878 RepID=A0A327YY86_9ACTN|nr:family 78 glycoside hydrolase catalytic domain [Actinoplanes lutulentus]MBB2947531.1 alpha-L-rhamnosidase [Actinoplanes lutulentus]RAK25687.1 alpha-L-rhamnosidase [Actinoplanes lutulentus]